MSFKRKSELNRFYYFLLPIVAVSTFLLGLFLVSQTLNFVTALVTMVAGVGTLIGFWLIHYWYLFRPTVNTYYAYAGLIIALLPVGTFSYLYATGSLLTLTEPPTQPAPPIILGVNSTLTVKLSNNLVITGLTEVQLYQTTNQSNWTSWESIDISGNWSSTEFYNNDWLNADMFNMNLTGYDSQGRSVSYWLRTRAWHKLSEWANATYTPPSWWFWSALPPEAITSAKSHIEENETCPTWNMIASGENTITLISVPYTNYLKIENSATFEQWNSSDGAYADNYTQNWEISINNPLNESERGFNAEYDWETSQWFGAWLIASSNNSENINRTWVDSYGNDNLLWFNVTLGRNYIGVILNNSIVADTTYDVAILLKTFNYDLTFNADIQIWNSSQGIHWSFGYGFEDNIQIVRQL